MKKGRRGLHREVCTFGKGEETNGEPERKRRRGG